MFAHHIDRYGITVGVDPMAAHAQAAGRLTAALLRQSHHVLNCDIYATPRNRWKSLVKKSPIQNFRSEKIGDPGNPGGEKSRQDRALKPAPLIEFPRRQIVGDFRARP